MKNWIWKLSIRHSSGSRTTYDVWSQSPEFASKASAYRYCRQMNGKRSGGNAPYRVQRVFS